MVPVKNCTGCSACRDRCPQQAIEMREDREGFLFPTIDENKCNQCGLCIEICPVKTTVLVETIDEPTVYAAWTKDRELLRRSTSGGVFSEIARSFLDKGGVVFGAAYDENMVVRHVAVEAWDDLDKLRGSKYVQSDVGDSFRQTKHYLDDGRYVLYSGTPCQIAGLYAVVGKNYNNLLTCGLICHGVPSPKVFRMYLDTMKKRYNSKVNGFAFRNKRNGWKHPTVRIEMENGKIINESNLDNHYNLGFLKNIFLRTSCYQCPIKTGEIVADIIIGDFWELAKYQPKLMNHEGTSAILIKTHRGHKAIEACCNRMELNECPFDYLLHDSNLRKCVIAKADRSAFFADLDQLSFAELTKKYIKPRSAIIREIAKLRRFCIKWINQVKRR
jgi:coenzyme F420-reducing hydrogenase beta subunit